ncbi:phage tail tape measure protein [Streptomyces sp. SID8499]|uniref:phage tail tape measure protein n=1 Tax=Streptomyces sp. SID8499 TaxID=2706106 RepID=UPI0013DB3326|nr:phage tail tape measure protein [Streptomyces sp. SID8499]
MRQTGQQLGDAAEQAGQDAGQQLGGGLIRGADGQWRNMRGELVDAVTAAAAEAEAEARRAGQQTGQRFTEGIDRGARQAGDSLADGIRTGGGEATTAAGQAGDESGQSFLARMRARGQSGMGELGSSFREEFTGKLAMAAVGVAAAGTLIEGFGQALEQGQIVAKLRAQLGATAPEAQRYGKIAGQLYTSAVVDDFETAADTIRAVMGAGLIPDGATNAQIQSIATKAQDLANTFDVDLTTSAQAAAGMIKNGLAKDSTQAFDLLAKGMDGLGPAGEDLVETFREYSPVFKSAGLSGQTALGLIRQGVQGGWVQDTDKIADAFKELQIRATEGSDGVKDAFKTLGLDAKKTGDDIAAGGKRGEQGMDLVLKKLKKLGPNTQEAKQIVSTLFGGPGEDLGAALFALDVGKASKSMDGAAGSSQKLGDSLRDNAATQVEQFKRKASQAFIDVLGAKVLPVVSQFTGYLSEHKDVAKAVAVGVTALGIAFGIAAVSVWAMNSALLANPITWIIVGIAAAVILIIAYWGQIKSATLAAWDWVVNKITAAKDLALIAIGGLASIPGDVGRWFGQAKDWALAHLLALVAWLTGLPGRVTGAISSMGAKLVARASSAWQSFTTATAAKIVGFLSYVSGLPGRITRTLGNMGTLLVGKGRDIVRGLWNGILGMGGWLRSKIMGWAKSVIPGPVAKALGIHSPSRVMRDQIGRWIPRGIVAGIEGEAPAVDRAMRNLVSVPTASATAASVAVQASGAAGANGGGSTAADVVRIGSDGSEFGNLVISTLRKAVASRGGNVQFAITGTAA